MLHLPLKLCHSAMMEEVVVDEEVEKKVEVSEEKYLVTCKQAGGDTASVSEPSNHRPPRAPWAPPRAPRAPHSGPPGQEARPWASAHKTRPHTCIIISSPQAPVACVPPCLSGGKRGQARIEVAELAGGYYPPRPGLGPDCTLDFDWG